MNILQYSKPIDCQTFIKNSHQFTKIHIHNNEQLLLVMQPFIMSTSASFNRSTSTSATIFIYRYSLEKINIGQPSLIDILEIKSFSNFPINNNNHNGNLQKKQSQNDNSLNNQQQQNLNKNQIMDLTTLAFYKNKVNLFMGYQSYINNEDDKNDEGDINGKGRKKRGPCSKKKKYQIEQQQNHKSHPQLKQIIPPAVQKKIEKQNPLLNPTNFKNRLNYLTTKHPQIKQFHVNKKGDILLLTLDGRGVFLKRHQVLSFFSNSNNLNLLKKSYNNEDEIFLNEIIRDFQYSSIDSNKKSQISLEKIISLCFLKKSQEYILAVTEKSIYLIKIKNNEDLKKHQVLNLQFKLYQNIIQVDGFVQSSFAIPPLSFNDQKIKQEIKIKIILATLYEIILIDLKVENCQNEENIMIDEQKLEIELLSKKSKQSKKKSKVSNFKEKQKEIQKELKKSTQKIKIQSQKTIHEVNNHAIDKFFLYFQKNKPQGQFYLYYGTWNGVYKYQFYKNGYSGKIIASKYPYTTEICQINPHGDFLLTNLQLFFKKFNSFKDQKQQQKQEQSQESSRPKYPAETINAEKIRLASQTKNGIIYCLTTHYQNNYKQGRIVLFVPDAKIIVKNCLLNVQKTLFQIENQKKKGQKRNNLSKSQQQQKSLKQKPDRKRSRNKKQKNISLVSLSLKKTIISYQPIDFKDLKNLKITQWKNDIRHLLQPIMKSYIQQLKNHQQNKPSSKFQFKVDTEPLYLSQQDKQKLKIILSEKEMEVLIINLSEIAALKDKAKQRFIKKAISIQLNLSPSNQDSNNEDQIQNNDQKIDKFLKGCVFTGQKIFTQKVKQCKQCGLFMIDKNYLGMQIEVCYICWNKLNKIQF